MARLQKKHSSKEKNKKKEISDSAVVTNEKQSVKTVSSAVKNLSSSSKKGNSIKNSTPNPSGKKNIFTQGIEFLQEVQSELKKVTWPTKKQTISTTLVVIVLVAIVSIFLGLFDFGFSQLIHAVLA